MFGHRWEVDSISAGISWDMINQPHGQWVPQWCLLVQKRRRFKGMWFLRWFVNHDCGWWCPTNHSHRSSNLQETKSGWKGLHQHFATSAAILAYTHYANSYAPECAHMSHVSTLIYWWYTYVNLSKRWLEILNGNLWFDMIYMSLVLQHMQSVTPKMVPQNMCFWPRPPRRFLLLRWQSLTHDTNCHQLSILAFHSSPDVHTYTSKLHMDSKWRWSTSPSTWS